MKKIIISLLTIFMFNPISVSLSLSSTDIGEAVKVLPESTDFIIKFSSTKDFYDYLSVTDKSFLGETIEDINDIKDYLGFNPFDLKELESNGFDIAKPFGIAVSDIKIVNSYDNSKSNDNPNMNIMIFLPVKDVDKAVGKIKEIVEEDNLDAKFTKKGDLWSWYIEIDSSEPEDLEEGEVADSEDEITQENKDESQKIDTDSQTKSSEDEEPGSVDESEILKIQTYMVSKNGYLFIGANPQTDARKFFETFGKDGKHLIDTPEFTNVAKKANPSNDLFLYANLGRIFNSNPDLVKYLSNDIQKISDSGENNKDIGTKDSNAKSNTTQIANFNYLKDYQGFGITADFKSSDLKADFILNVVEKSPLLNMFKGVTPKRDLILGLKDNPLLLIGVVENIQAYWKMIKETLDKISLDAMEKEFATVKTDYGIDVEKDIIENIGNNLTLGTYDGMSINMTNINTLASIEFKDPVKMKTVIDKLIAKLPPDNQSMVNRVDINGSQIYMIIAGPFQLYAGFIGNNLVVTLGKPMFEKAMSAEIENGFIKNFKETKLTTSLKQDVSIFFLDFKESIYAVKNFVPMFAAEDPEIGIIMMPEFQKIVEPFKYISAFSRIDGNAIVGEFLFKTDFNKPFFQGVKEANSEIAALKKKAVKQ
ncbi:MAG: hypothetical protein HQK72_05630 [Desulfamplus sp.]|nr:hypothetical protein [Desulfamplus sp.]